MALELKKESIGIRQAVGEDTTHMIIENDIIVPDVKPDVAKILLLDGDILTETIQTDKERVTLSGNVRLKVLYQADEPEESCKGIAVNFPYTRDLSVANSNTGMIGKAKCAIEHIDYNIINSRKINVRIVAGVNIKVSDDANLEIVSDLRGVDNVQMLRKTFGVNLCTSERTSEYNVSEFVDIPEGKPTISEILWSDVRTTGSDFKVADGKIAATAALRISTLYIGDDEEKSIQYVENEIPMAQEIDIDDINDDAIINAQFDIAQFSTDIAEDSDGERRVLKIEALIKITASGYKKQELELIEDAYSPKSKFTFEKNKFDVESLQSENKSRFSVKDGVLLDEQLPDIAEVFNVSWKPGLPEYVIEDRNMAVEGYISSNILYLSNDAANPIVSVAKEIPFRQVIDLKDVREGCGFDLDLDVENLSYSVISSKNIEMRANICITVRAVEKVELPLITKVNEIPVEFRSDFPSYTIYFAQPGDNLWKIAKRYLVSIDELRSNNTLEEGDAVAPGTQVLITKRSS